MERLAENLLFIVRNMVFLTSIRALKGATMPTGLFFLSGTFGGKESASLEELNELMWSFLDTNIIFSINAYIEKSKYLFSNKNITRG